MRLLALNNLVLAILVITDNTLTLLALLHFPSSRPFTQDKANRAQSSIPARSLIITRSAT